MGEDGLKMHKINELPGYIELGNLNEKGVCEIAVDVSAWVALYPTGTFAITYIRPTESAVYPVAAYDIVVADGILTWTVSDTVTATAGSGSMVIQCAVGDTIVKKSPLIQTVIGAGHEPAGEAPDPVADWVADATSKLAEVDESLESANVAEGIREVAETGRKNAETSRVNAEGIRRKNRQIRRGW